MKKLLPKLNRIKIRLLVLAGAFLFPLTVLAQEKESYDGFAGFLSWFFIGIINALTTNILLPLINLVVKIVSYNDFLGSRAVEIGWPLVRDISNMFFVVFLLVIAFSTILKVSKYHYKTALFKLILMAVLINFSKTIMGFLIDFGQVIMLTFVIAFRDAAANNLVHAFGLTEVLNIPVDPNDPNDTINNWEIFGSLMLGLIMVVVACGVMLAYVGVLLYRIIALWILVILSPLAFLLSAFDGTAKYASEIWSKFWSQLTTGIILAFFLWLSLSIIAFGLNADSDVASASQVSEWDRLFSFVVSIALLLTALQYAQQAGGFAGAFAGKVSGTLSQIGSKAVRTGMRTGSWIARKPAWTAIKAGTNRLYEKTGFDLDVKRRWGAFQSARAERIGKQIQTGRGKAGEALESGGRFRSRVAFVGGAYSEQYRQFGYWTGAKKLFGASGGMGKAGQEEHAERRENMAKLEKALAARKAIEKAKEEKKSYADINENLLSEKTLQEKAEIMKKFAVAETDTDGVRKKKNDSREQELKNIFENNHEGEIDNNWLTKKGRKEQEDIKKEQSSEIINEDEAKNRLDNLYREDADRQGKAIAQRPLFIDVEGQKVRRGLEEEELKKLASIDNSAELVAIFKTAQSNRDKVLMAAVLKKLASDANTNDILNMMNYDSGFEGYKNFYEKEVKQKGGFSDDHMMSLANEVSYRNEGVNHWMYARTNKMEYGKTRWNSKEEQAKIVSNEVGKRDDREIVKRLNRLGVGYETPEGEFHVDAGGARIIREHASAWNQKLINEHMNISLAKNLLAADRRDGTLHIILKGLKAKNDDGQVFKDESGKEIELADYIVKYLENKVVAERDPREAEANIDLIIKDLETNREKVRI